MSKLKIRIMGLIVFIIVLMFGLVLSANLLNLNAESEKLFEGKYLINSVVKIPQHSLTINGKSVESICVVNYPNGKAINQKEIILDEVGKYTAEYRANVQGVNYTEKYEFVVEQALSSVTASNDSVYYGTHPNAEENIGLVAKIGSSSTYKLNQIIDLSKVGDSTEFITVYPIPEKIGSIDCRSMIIRLEDAFDSSNYILIRAQQSMGDQEVLYIGARAYNQPSFYGYGKGKIGDTEYTGSYGFTAKGSFYGRHIGEESYAIKVGYNNATKVVHAYSPYGKNSGDIVIDLDNSACFGSKVFKGFSSDKVRLSIYGDTFEKSNMSFMATSISQVNLSSENLDISKLGDIAIDYGDYTETTYPIGAVGKKYPIFPAKALELYTPERLTEKVYMGYKTSIKHDIDIQDGCFVPQSKGIYTIEYSARDGFGNLTKKTVDVNIVENATPITFDIDTTPLELEAGESLTPPTATNILGGNGNVKIVTKLVDSQNAETVFECSTKVVKSGNYKVVYTAMDYIRQTVVKEITLKAKESTMPRFVDAPKLPMYYIIGAKYKIPEVKAEDYSTGAFKLVDSKVSIKEDTVAAVLSNGLYTVGKCKQVSLTYTATDANGKSNSVTYLVSTRDVGFPNNLDMTKYFVGENGTITGALAHLKLSSSQENSKFTFIRELMSSFEVRFSISETEKNSSAVVFWLTDYLDSSVTVKVKIMNVDGKAFLSVNDGEGIALSKDFGGKDVNFELNITDNVVSVGTVSAIILNDFGGRPFEGMKSGLVTMDITFEDLSGVTSIYLKNLNRQLMSNSKFDIAAPRMVYEIARGSNNEIGNVLSISKAFAIDVLDPYVTYSMSLQFQDKSYITSQDGVELKNVSADRPYDIKLSKYGRFMVTYSCMDSSEVGEAYSYIINCEDKEKPEITLSKTSFSAKAGETLVVPTFTVKDNYSAKNKITVEIMVISSDGQISYYDKEFAPSAGQYTIRYMAFDENYNMIFADAVCTVK